MPNVPSFAISTFIAVLMVVDPFAAIPLFLTMTKGDTAARKRQTALKASLTVLVALLFFATTGEVVFRVFGITLGAFRCAGGLLLLLMAIDMMRAERSTTRTTDREVAEGMDKPEVGIVPLGIPILAGPGAIATATVLASGASTSATKTAAVVGSIIATAIITYATLRAAPLLATVLKTTGLNVLNRVMGLILAAVAVQFMADGVRDLISHGIIAAPAAPSP